VRAFFLIMVASFVLWGVGDMLRVVGTSTWVAKVGNTTIEAPQLEAEYRRDLSVMTRNLPSGQEPSAELRREVGQQALQSLVGQAAMNQELRSLHIVVSDSVLVATTHKLPAFLDANGQFDKARLDAVLRSQNLTEAGFIELMRGEIAQRQLLDAVAAGAQVPNAEAAAIYAARFEKRSADMAQFPIASVPEPAVPDEATERRWYDNHPDLYATPEYRRITVIVLSPATLASEVTVTDQDVQAAYDAHKAEYTTIAKRSAQVISITDATKATALADQWRAGADWAAMQAAAQTDGAAAIEQNDATQTQFPDPDLAKAVFSAPVDTVPAPIKGALGWFVIRVTHAVQGGVESFDQVKDRLRQRLVTEKALGLVYDKANKIDGELGNGTSLAALPPDPGVANITVTLDQNGDTPEDRPAALPGEAEIRSAIPAAAFAAQKGDPPQLTEVQTPSVGGSGYYALSVDDITPAGEKPFDAVRDNVVQDWRADQRRHSAETAAAAMLQAVKAGKPFSDAARDAGILPTLSPLVTRNQPDPAMPRQVQQVLFSLKKGEPTMVETPEGFLVATAVEIVAPDPATDPTRFDQLRAAESRTLADDMGAAFSEALRLRANPSINQTNVDQIVQP
ncbi:MAG TPA: peptidyl-prolyl cis-trans isomerase, partial [Acetobacteraceae bacterium]|nr:peptidyl-prolyl cis-trans isomerase [Acetobacteraceae bacterium]